MRITGKLLITLAVIAFLGSIGTGQPGAGFVFMLICGGIGGGLLYAAGAQNRKYRRLGEETSTYYEQIRTQPQREPTAPAQQQTAGRIEPPPDSRSQSLEAGLFDE